MNIGVRVCLQHVYSDIVVIKVILVLVSVSFFQHSFLHYLVLVTGSIIILVFII